MASSGKAARRIADAPADDQQALVPDEVLELIFLRMGSGPELARASTVCRAFRRVATDHSFLRRFLSLHPPPIVGLVDNQERDPGFFPALSPHRSAPAASAVLEAGGFSFSFLPSAGEPYEDWCVLDGRDGRLLLYLKRYTPSEASFLELVVCDPLYRRYVQIPPIPADIVPHMPPSGGEMKSEAFLAPADDEEQWKSEEKARRFRVIYNWISNYKLVSFVFDAATGKWRCATAFRFLPARLILEPRTLVRYYARGCFYWIREGEKGMLVLDPREMKFSNVEFLYCDDTFPRPLGQAIIDAAADRLGLVTLGSRELNISSRACQNNGVVVGEEEWQHDRSIPYPEPGDHSSSYTLIGVAQDYLLLRGFRRRNEMAGPLIECFALDLKTWTIERLGWLRTSCFHAHPFASFPPPLAPPSL